jgi:hypothetical protein
MPTPATTPETRLVNQCLHTRYKAEKPPLVTAFAKQAVLTAAFERSSVIGLLLPRLAIITSPNAKELVRAVHQLHQSGSATAILAGIPIEEIREFAHAAVNAEAELSKGASGQLTTAVSALNAPKSVGTTKGSAATVASALVQTALHASAPGAHDYLAAMRLFPLPAPSPVGLTIDQASTTQAFGTS